VSGTVYGIEGLNAVIHQNNKIPSDAEFLKINLIKICGALHVYLQFSEVFMIVRVNGVYFLRTA
jgi:hypothetical protein